MATQTHSTKGFEKILKDIKGELGQKILEKFSRLSTTETCFQFVWNLSSVHKILGANSCRKEKNLAAAQVARKNGNLLFQKKKYKEAIHQYNISVINAPADRDSCREELTLSLANRSAALYHLKEYQRCIDDIEYSLEMGYPEQLHYKLHDRLGKCYLSLGDRSNAVGYLKKANECLQLSDLNAKGKEIWQNNLNTQLQQAEKITESTENGNGRRKMFKPPPEVVNQNPQYPCASAAFETHYTQEKGRYARAKDDIKVGDVILVEKAYSSVLISEHIDTHCNHCLLRFAVPYPCLYCTSVKYCSSACQHLAWESYHYAECTVMDWLTEEWMGQMSYLAMKTVLVTGMKTLLENYKKKDTQNQEQNCQKNQVYGTSYDSITQLVGHEEKHTADEMFQFSVMSVLIVKLLKLTEFWPESYGNIVESPDDLLLAVGCSVIRLLCINQCNSFNIAEMLMHEDFRLCKPQDIGLGLYPTAALMNHSCCPNVDCNYYGNYNVYRAIQNIKAGEEINIDYGLVFYSNSFIERQHKLSDQYFFRCQCPACVEDWPLAENINNKCPIFLCSVCSAQLNSTVGSPGTCKQCASSCDITLYLQELHQSHVTFVAAMSKVMQGNYQEALPILKKHLTLLQDYIAAPWREFFTCQATIKQCFSIMGNASTDYAL